MNTKEKIGKLEALLARVQARANAPRTPFVAAAASALPSPGPAVLAPPPQPQRTSSPAPPAVARHPTPPPDTRAEMDDDVEVSAGVVEIDIDVEEGIPMESGAHAVAAQTEPPEEQTEYATDTNRHPEGEVAHADAEAGYDAYGEAPAAAPANEIVEPEPSSSPRPIAEETPEESAPRHTPPPESGKQVAAAPSVHPAAPPRKSTAPPPSEGHTLIGGWREPGLDAPQIREPAAAYGVRVPAPAPAQPPPPQASGTRLSPDVTRAELPARAEVASFEGALPVAKPATFGELVDAALSL